MKNFVPGPGRLRAFLLASAILIACATRAAAQHDRQHDKPQAQPTLAATPKPKPSPTSTPKASDAKPPSASHGAGKTPGGAAAGHEGYAGHDVSKPAAAGDDPHRGHDAEGPDDGRPLRLRDRPFIDERKR